MAALILGKAGTTHGEGGEIEDASDERVQIPCPQVVVSDHAAGKWKKMLELKRRRNGKAIKIGSLADRHLTKRRLRNALESDGAADAADKDECGQDAQESGPKRVTEFGEELRRTIQEAADE